MKSELAEELLDALMSWDRAAFAEKVRRLEAMASHKWDEYGNFRPGVKFFESLAAWLYQFDDPVDRATGLDFVLDRLIFLSDAEMTHLIELVYPEHMEPVLLDRVAETTGISRFRVHELVSHDEFLGLRRRSLVLGASDGARLDRLRRSAPFLSHEQFFQSSEPPRGPHRADVQEADRGAHPTGARPTRTLRACVLGRRFLRQRQDVAAD